MPKIEKAYQRKMEEGADSKKMVSVIWILAQKTLENSNNCTIFEKIRGF